MDNEIELCRLCVPAYFLIFTCNPLDAAASLAIINP